MNSPLRVLAVIGAALVLMVGGAIAYAAIPSANGTFTACMVKASGTIRMVEASETCRPAEQKITWNQQGQPGTNGTNGNPGTNGTNGVSGWEVVPGGGTSGELTGSTQFGIDVTCPLGKVPTGGGGSAFAINSAGNSVAQTDLRVSRPKEADLGGFDGWHVIWGTTDGGVFPAGSRLRFSIYVICVTAN